jgi:hypothetical protein
MARLLRGLGVGLLLGAGWGVLARGFMRLLTTEPSFSWEGTSFIVGIFAVAGALVGLVHAARAAGRSGWWRLAGLPTALVFFGQGLLLLPGAVGFACVLRGGRLVRVVGALLVAVPPVLVVALAGDASFLTITPAQLAGLGLMTVSAAPLGWALAELVRRWRPHEGPLGAPDDGPAAGVPERAAAGAPV